MSLSKSMIVKTEHYAALKRESQFYPLSMLFLAVVCSIMGVYFGVIMGESNVFSACSEKKEAVTTSKLLIHMKMQCMITEKAQK